MLGAISGLLKPVSPLPQLSGPALVLGSGPGACLPTGFDDTWTLATVNGSQAVAARLGCRSPNITLLGASVLKNQPANREAQAVLKARGTETLISIRGRRRFSLARFHLARLGYTFDRFCLISGSERLDFISSVLDERIGVNLKPSNGVALAFICLHLGAAGVVMTGFSLSRGGHAYNDKNRPRQHTAEDRELLRRSAVKGVPIYAGSVEFAQESGIPLYTEKETFPSLTVG